MTNHGFIDPGAGERDRIDRLEAIITELLPLVPLTALAPEVQQMVADLNSDNEVRKERARRRFHELAADDPIEGEARDE
jgi:hypothetical protein